MVDLAGGSPAGELSAHIVGVDSTNEEQARFKEGFAVDGIEKISEINRYKLL